MDLKEFWMDLIGFCVGVWLLGGDCFAGRQLPESQNKLFYIWKEVNSQRQISKYLLRKSKCGAFMQRLRRRILSNPFQIVSNSFKILPESIQIHSKSFQNPFEILEQKFEISSNSFVVLQSPIHILLNPFEIISKSIRT